MNLTGFLRLMNELAPLELAAEWDNVGLLLAPSREREIERVLLTIDLTERVLGEAEQWGAHAIVAYHPPIFSGLKRLLPTDRSGALVLRSVESGLLLYSPHTALDAVSGGINDWLAEAFPVASAAAIEPHAASAPDAAVGQGRLLKLARPLTLPDVLQALKRHLAISHLRLAACPAHEHAPLQTVALCAGAGGSVLNKVRADLYVTGEMRHHDVLHAVESGTSVVLTEHSHSERGYLPRLRERLLERGKLEVAVSTLDCDPLRVA
jgi:dinuclear metal center YbgI/SA1388 family protein